MSYSHYPIRSALSYPLCDIASFGGFLPGPWTVTRSSLRRVRWVAVARSAVGPVRVASRVCAIVLSSGAGAGAAGVVLRWFPSGALDRHPVLPPQTASGR